MTAYKFGLWDIDLSRTRIWRFGFYFNSAIIDNKGHAWHAFILTAGWIFVTRRGGYVGPNWEITNDGSLRQYHRPENLLTLGRDKSSVPPDASR